MVRFRPVAVFAAVALIAVLTASDLVGKGRGGGGKGGGGHKAAPHRAAPKVHAAHHSGPKPNRVVRKSAPHHASHPAKKQAHHPAKPKTPLKVAKQEAQHKEPPRKAPPKDEHGKQLAKKDPGKPAKPPEKKDLAKRPDQRSKQADKQRDEKRQELAKDRRSDDKRRERDRAFVGRRHAAVHHFAHFDRRHHWYAFDRHWWYNFVSYPDSCDDGQDVPGEYCADDGDPASWVNYEAVVPPADVEAEPPPVIKEGVGLPISRAGAMLAERLDGMDVENHWLSGQDVSWRTGNPVDDNPGPASNSGAFVAAVCARLKVIMAEPVPASFFPDSQYDWFVNEGTGSGWVALGGDVEAQLLANQGWVVVAAWKAPVAGSDRSTDGQTAIVHPDSKPVEAVADRGPQITVAGVQNHNDIALKDSFPPAAWDHVVYLACRPRW